MTHTKNKFFTKVTISRNDVIVKFFDVFLCLLSSLVAGSSFMSISSLVLELWLFSFIRDWPENRKSEIPLSEFCQISGDWEESCIPNLARMPLIECYWMLQNSRVTAYAVFELSRENQLGGKITPTQIRVKTKQWRFLVEIYQCSVKTIRRF